MLEFYLWCVAEIAHNFSDVLNNCYVILPAVVPELRCREFTAQYDCDAWK